MRLHKFAAKQIKMFLDKNMSHAFVIYLMLFFYRSCLFLDMTSFLKSKIRNISHIVYQQYIARQMLRGDDDFLFSLERNLNHL